MEDKQLYDKFMADVIKGHERSLLSLKNFDTGYIVHTDDNKDISLIKDKINDLKDYIHTEAFSLEALS